MAYRIYYKGRKTAVDRSNCVSHRDILMYNVVTLKPGGSMGALLTIMMAQRLKLVDTSQSREISSE
jgi:hypothetical protein